MLRSAVWIGPWILGMVIIGWLGRYGDGSHSVLPEWSDLLVVIVFSLVIFYWAVEPTMPRERGAGGHREGQRPDRLRLGVTSRPWRG